MTEPLTGRVLPAGTGAIVFAVYWTIGAIALSLPGAVVLEALPRQSPAYTAYVVGQAVAILAWLAFVVSRAARGGRFELRGDVLRFKKFVLWSSRTLRDDPQPAKMVTHVQGNTYVNGPALVFRTDAADVSVATMDPALGERLGILATDAELTGPTLVIEPHAFAALAARYGFS